LPVHTVEQGDCLSSIAKQYGFSDWRLIYNHPENAAFKRKRPNPNCICPGDQIFIPEKEIKQTGGATDAKHKFKLDSHKTLVRLRLMDEEGKVFAGKKYRLDVDGTVHEGTTPGDGLIEKEIPPDARSGQLTVWLDEDTSKPGFTWKLKIGHLDPVEEKTGVQARLKNLGFDCGPVDGVVGPRTQAALRGFQSRAGIPETGQVDAATIGKLRDQHDLG
jgi:Putative peptidoglycan binding domain